MLPKSSQRVAEVIRIANQVAREYEREYIGTEHMLVAVQREGTGVGATILARHGITTDVLQAEIEKLVKAQLEETWVFGRLPGTPHFKNVMATAIKQCQHLGGKEVSTEHILLALLKERGCVAEKALRSLGLTFDIAKSDILESMSK